MGRTLAVVVLFGLLVVAGRGLAPPAGATYDPSDEWQGLPEGEGREEVYFNCVACHSMAIVQQQRMNETVWQRTLTRMVDEMGMPALPEDEHELVIDYLVEHFGQDVPR
jgi:hypothetical protein